MAGWRDGWLSVPPTSLVSEDGKFQKCSVALCDLLWPSDEALPDIPHALLSIVIIPVIVPTKQKPSKVLLPLCPHIYTLDVEQSNKTQD